MDRLLTLAETAERLQVPEATLRYWRHAGTGPASIKVGRHIRYRLEDLTAWLQSNTTTPAA